MQTNPGASWPDAKAPPSDEELPQPACQLLLRLPDLSQPAAPGPLGRLRLNWRRGRNAASARPWWTGGSAKWLGAAAAVLIVLAALLTALGPSQPAPRADETLADATREKPQPSSAAHAPSVVPAGYQTADSVSDPTSKGHGASLLSLHPARLTGSIETVDTEVGW